MTDRVTVARPYALAAFDVAKAHEVNANWSDVLQVLAQMLQDTALQQFLHNPVVALAKRVDMLLDLLGDAKVAVDKTDLFRNFLTELAEHNKLLLLAEIAKLFKEAQAASAGKVQVQVVSATAVSSLQQEKIMQVLQQRLGQTPECEYVIDESIVGGMIIRTPDWVMDGSVVGKLNKLKESLSL